MIVEAEKLHFPHGFQQFSHCFLHQPQKNGIEKCTTAIIEKCTTLSQTPQILLLFPVFPLLFPVFPLLPEILNTKKLQFFANYCRHF